MVRVLKDNNLLYPVEISTVEHGPLAGLAWLPPRSFLFALAKTGDLSHILGGFNSMKDASSMLTVFWERYKAIHPSFKLFEEIAAKRKRPEQCVPIYLHGDEGVTYKKHGVLIFSWQSPLGYGSSRRAREISLNLEAMGENGLPLNFLKSGMYSRMLTIVCKKEGGLTSPNGVSNLKIDLLRGSEIYRYIYI